MNNINMVPGIDGIWDDGEFVHWDEINPHIHWDDEGELLSKLIQIAKEYYEFTDRPLPIYGEIGELFAQRQYGFDRHRTGAQGSDGVLLNDFYEVKTITPFKNEDFVKVKKSGNFNKLVIVKITADHQISSKLFDREHLPKPKSNFYIVPWKHKI